MNIEQIKVYCGRSICPAKYISGRYSVSLPTARMWLAKGEIGKKGLKQDAIEYEQQKEVYSVFWMNK